MMLPWLGSRAFFTDRIVPRCGLRGQLRQIARLTVAAASAIPVVFVTEEDTDRPRRTMRDEAALQHDQQLALSLGQPSPPAVHLLWLERARESIRHQRVGFLAGSLEHDAAEIVQ